MSNLIETNAFIKKKLIDTWFNFYKDKSIEQLLELSVEYHYLDERNFDNERIQGLIKVLKERNMMYMVEYFTGELHNG